MDAVKALAQKNLRDLEALSRWDSGVHPLLGAFNTALIQAIQSDDPTWNPEES